MKKFNSVNKMRVFLTIVLFFPCVSVLASSFSNVDVNFYQQLLTFLINEVVLATQVVGESAETVKRVPLPAFILLFGPFSLFLLNITKGFLRS